MPDELPPQPGFTPDPAVPPTAATPAPVPLAPPSTTTGAGTGLTPNVAAGLSVLFTWVSGLVFLLIEKRDQFVRFWAMQAIFFGGAWFVFVIASTIIGNVLGHIAGILALLWGLCALVVHLGFLALWILMLVKSFSGKEWEIPFLGKLARQQLANLKV